MAKQKSLEDLRKELSVKEAELEKAKQKLEQVEHKMNRLQNRIKTESKKQRDARTHALCFKAGHVKLNQQLFDFTFDFNIHDYGLDYEMPAYFISGSCDWVCPVDPIREYEENVKAPSSDFLVIDGPGHNLQYSVPKEFAVAVKCVLEK